MFSGRDAAKEILFRLPHSGITIVWADSAYAGKLVTWAKRRLNLTIKTVSRPRDTSGLIVLRRRWAVERSLAWMMNARRHARDYERLVLHSEALITWAAIMLMARRITRSGRKSSWTNPPHHQEQGPFVPSPHLRVMDEVVNQIETGLLIVRVGKDSIPERARPGIIAARFHHHDTRDGQPLLHDHLVISVKVRREDGQWPCCRFPFSMSFSHSDVLRLAPE